MRGQVNQAIGDKQAAIRDFQKTLELDPKHPSAAKSLQGLAESPASPPKTLTPAKPGTQQAAPPPQPAPPAKASAATEPKPAAIATPPVARPATAAPPRALPTADEFTPLEPGIPPPPKPPGTEDIEKLPYNFPSPSTKPPRFPEDNPCNMSYWTWAGVPWKPAPIKPAGADAPATAVSLAPFDFDDYNAQATRAMEAVRLVYGAMSPEQTKFFESLWVPFFDFPNAADYDYFVKLNPLLADYHWLTSQLSGAGPAFEENMQHAAIAAGLRNSDATRSALATADGQAKNMADLNQRLKGALASLQKLGDPPNPLAEKCAARRHHREAVEALMPSGIEGEWTGEWTELTDKLQPLHTPIQQALRSRTAQFFSDQPFPNLQQKTGAKGLHIIITKRDMPAVYQKLNCGPDCQQFNLYNFDRMTLEEAEKTVLDRDSAGHVLKTLADAFLGGPVGFNCWWMFRNVILPPLQKMPDGSYAQRIRYIPNYFYGHIDQSITIRAAGDRLTIDWIGILNRPVSAVLDSGKVVDPTGSVLYAYQARLKQVPRKPGYKLPEDYLPIPKYTFGMNNYSLVSSDAANAQPTANANATPKNEPPPPPAEDAEAKAEAISQYQAEIKSIQGNIAWLEGQLKTAGPDAKKALQGQLEWQNHVLQKTQDLITSVRTGEIVNTRTALDDKTTQQFVGKVKDEIAEISAENQILSQLAGVTGLMEGAEGVALREQVQQQVTEALKSKDRLGALKKIAANVSGRLQAQGERQQEKARENLEFTNRLVEGAEMVKTAADMGMLIGGFFASGGTNLPLFYGMGTGYFEGGVGQALENGARGYSMTVDTFMAGVHGFTAVDPKTQKMRGFTGAAQEAATTAAMNTLMVVAGGAFHGSETPVPAPGKSPASAQPKGKPEFEAFLDNAQRMERDILKVKGQFESRLPKRPDGTVNTEHPDYQKAKAAIDGALGPVNEQYKIIAQRQQMKDELAQVTKKYENNIPQSSKNNDGTVKTSDPAYQKVKQQWEAEMKSVRDQYKPRENRQNLHEQVVAKLGFKEGDIKASGGAPESINSDMDFMVDNVQKGRDYVNAMSKHVLEYPDRWVVTDMDITVWKPPKREKVGSSAQESSIWYDTEIGSDKFPTPGGVYDTSSGLAGIFDPRGAVISNKKKASEAGISGKLDKPDLHIVGKSVDKAIGIANRSAGKTMIKDPDFTKKAYAVRKHASSEEAGITTFGNPPEAKKAETQQFLDKACDHMAEAYTVASTASAAVDRANEQRLRKFMEKGQLDEVRKLREQMITVRIADESALKAIGLQDPKLIARIGIDQGDLIQKLPNTPPASAGGIGWLWSDLQKGLSADQIPPTLQPPPQPVSPILKAVADDATQLAKAIETQVLPGQAKGSPQAAYFTKLKTIMERAGKDPARGLHEIRQLTGYDAAQVLRDLKAAIQLPKQK